MITDSPILRTQRLELRSLTPDDATLMLAVWNTPEFIRFVGDRGIRSVAEAREALLNGPIATWQEFGYGPFRVGLQADGTGLGVCGLFRRRGLDVPDLGVALLGEYYRQGFGVEASQAVLAHCDTVLRLPRIAAIVDPENTASRAMLERLCFTRSGEIELGGDICDLFFRDRRKVPAMH